MHDLAMTPACRPQIDPARFEVVKNALISAAEEMKIVLAKTAYSPLLKVAGDYSCGIFDAGRQHGGARAGSADPSRLDAGCGARGDRRLPAGRAGRRVHPQRPLSRRLAPARRQRRRAGFFGERLLGFGCVRAHWPDIGSATPGSYGAVTEIYGEGLRLPPVRLYRDGEPDPDIEAIIFANVRTPAERQGRSARPGRREPARPDRGSRRWPSATAPTSCARSWTR